MALRQNRPREGRAPTGLAALRISTTDQQQRPVLDFWRCAMLPLRDPSAQTGHADDLDEVGHDVTGGPERGTGQRLAADPVRDRRPAPG